MAGVLVATLVAVIALVWIMLYALRQHVSRRERIDEELHQDATPTLEYDVPTGQDPTVIVAALDRAGYTATSDPHHSHQLVLVACPAGLDRERAHVRAVIESASVTTPQDGVPLQADVRFRDERG
jgi:hypothetical protein